MEKFISGIIDGPQFDKEFSQIWRLDRDKKYSCEEMLEIYNQNNQKLTEGFSALISRLFTGCDAFEPDFSSRDNYEIAENELKNCVKKLY